MEDKENFDYRQLSNVLQVSLLVVVAAFSIAIFIYWFVFNDGGLSTDQEIWGQFGDYLGGVINPIVAFMALMALVVSIRIQAKEMHSANEAMHSQLSHLKIEAIKSDLVRAIKSVDEEIGKLLESTYSPFSGFLPSPLYYCLSVHAEKMLNKEFENNKNGVPLLPDKYVNGVIILRERVIELSKILEKYDFLGSVEVRYFTNIYRRKLGGVFLDMWVIGMLNGDEALSLSVDEKNRIDKSAPSFAPAYLDTLVSEGDRWWSVAHD